MTRSASVRAHAKLNLDLRVLSKRPDGYHELRTIFQTISFADALELDWTPGRKLSMELDQSVEIPGNLVIRAAELCLEAGGKSGRLKIRLQKKIPMGAGLGGGSSDAAAILLALPVLAGFVLPREKLWELASALGSDVPFFLEGGTALGVGRGTELYPLPDAPSATGVLVFPGVHVSTAEAYRSLGRELTTELSQNTLDKFGGIAWGLAGSTSSFQRKYLGANDFQGVVFARYPEMERLVKRLEKLGAAAVRMTGSGSALFGIFEARQEALRAIAALKKERAAAAVFSVLNRAAYRRSWYAALAEHLKDPAWPPRSRYAR